MAVCSRDGDPVDLAALLAGAADQLREGDELVVVDSASRGEAVARAAADRGLTALRLERPGVSRARNLVLRSAATPVVLFTDDDCRPTPGWVDGIRAAFTPGVGLVCGGVVPTDDTGVPVSVLLGEAPYDVTLGTLDTAGHGANLAVDRAVALAAGGFDPLLGAGAVFPGAEDKDLVARVLQQGHRVVVQPDARVLHRPRRTRRAALSALHGYGLGAGAADAKLRSLHAPAQSPVPAGCRRAAAAWRDGYRFGVVLEASFVLGALRGQWRVRGLDVANGRFTRRGRP